MTTYYFGWKIDRRTHDWFVGTKEGKPTLNTITYEGMLLAIRHKEGKINVDINPIQP